MKCSYCEDDARARGMCQKHYRRWQRHGDPELEREVQVFCSLDFCMELHRARGFCMKHYRNWKRTGDPISLRERKRLGL